MPAPSDAPAQHGVIFSECGARNWRLTFSIDRNEAAIIDLDFEDYH